jgi:hypothetical protein
MKTLLWAIFPAFMIMSKIADLDGEYNRLFGFCVIVPLVGFQLAYWYMIIRLLGGF